MKKLNKTGFTLIELLAVIVILGVIMVIAVPAVTKYITNSKKDTYVATAKSFMSAVATSAAVGDYQLPLATNEVTIVSIKDVKLNKGGTTSSFGEAWNYAYSFVAIVNVGTAADPAYKYYFQGVDAKGNYIALTEENSLGRASVSKEATLATASIGTSTFASPVIYGITTASATGTGTVTPIAGAAAQSIVIGASTYTTLNIYYAA